MDPKETPNKSQLDSLSASIEKLKQKAKAIGEVNARIAVSDPMFFPLENIGPDKILVSYFKDLHRRLGL